MSELEDEVPGAIVCVTMRDSQGKETSHVNGAKVSVCAECLIEVWVAPTSIKLLEDHPDTPLWCLRCAQEHLKEDPDPTFLTAPGAPEELQVNTATLNELTQEATKIFFEQLEKE